MNNISSNHDKTFPIRTFEQQEIRETIQSFYTDGAYYNNNDNKMYQELPIREHQFVPASSLQEHVPEQEKYFERVHKWLASTHEYVLYHPTDDEQFSLRSNSAFEVATVDYSLNDDLVNRFPKYKSEEYINSDFEDLNKFTGLKRCYSPNLIRRRRYSPRSDPTLNKTLTIPPNNQGSLDQLYAKYNKNRSHEAPTVNRYFVHTGKGNTFPRRNKVSNHQHNQRTLNMGQQLERCRPLSYNERVMPNRYTSNSFNKIENIRQRQQLRPTSMLEERSFAALNGKVTTSDVNIRGTNCADSNLIGNMSLDTQRLFSGNLPDVALTAAKAIHKRELSNSLPKFQVGNESSHVRVSSAPEVLEDSLKQKQDVILREQCSSQVPQQIRKVKASSWPKRAVLPSHTDKYEVSELIPGNSLIKTESGYNTEKSEDKCEDKVDIIQVETVEIVPVVEDFSCEDNESSCGSDIPPARPPLPFLRHEAVENSFLISPPKSSKNSTIRLEEDNKIDLLKESQQTDETSVISEPMAVQRSLSSHSSQNDLSKKVSMSLRDLIRIHEKEIARVSAGVSSSLKAVDNLCEVAVPRTNYRRVKNKSNSNWKRHTTIGLLTNYDNPETFYINKNPHAEEALEIDSRSAANIEHRVYSSVSPFEQPDVFAQACNRLSISSQHSVHNHAVNEAPLNQEKTKNAPVKLPKPKMSLGSTVIVEPAFININNAREQFEQLSSPRTNVISPVSTQDSYVQTENTLSRSPSFKQNEERIKLLTDVNDKLRQNYDREQQLLQKKLDEQKKVANAYQKLEDRYRRKVYELQKIIRSCTCSTSRVKSDANCRRKHAVPAVPDNHDISVQKVDGILHQLEAWLNNQTSGIPTDSSEISSIIDSDEVFTNRYKVSPEHFSSPPLEIIDRIDATCV